MVDEDTYCGCYVKIIKSFLDGHHWLDKYFIFVFRSGFHRNCLLQQLITLMLKCVRLMNLATLINERASLSTAAIL